MIFRELKRVWSHNDMNYIEGFKEIFPELQKVSSEELCNRWSILGIDLYTQRKKTVNPLIRVTLPFAIILLLVMFLFLPICFLITGEWSYGKPGRIFNWFKSLKII